MVAPADGVVIRRSVQPGAVSAEGQEMFRLVRDGRLELDAKVPELELAAFIPARWRAWSMATGRCEATVRAVAPMVATDTRLGVVHIALPADSGLRPGMFARAEIVSMPRRCSPCHRRRSYFATIRPAAFVWPTAIACRCGD